MVTPVYMSDENTSIGKVDSTLRYNMVGECYLWICDNIGPCNHDQNCQWEQNGIVRAWYFKHLPAVRNKSTHAFIRKGLVEICFRYRKDAMYFKLVWGGDNGR
jgi:hypothetical protein